MMKTFLIPLLLCCTVLLPVIAVIVYHLIELAGRNSPLVVHGTPFEKWKSVNWTIENLSSRSNEIGHVLSKKGTSNIFKYFASNQPLSEINLTREEKDYKEVVYTAPTFFSILQNETTDVFHYYASGSLEMLNLGEVSTKESLVSMTFPSHTKAFAEVGEVNFWLGKAAVTAHTHYDTSYNLHQVVHGRKRFTLFPPDSNVELKLYPCLHQLYRQVGMDIPRMEKEGRLNEFLREVGGLQVELVGGDVLYIPPYWFHSVVTMETTFSLNIWSQSEAFLIMEDVYNSAIPFEAHWSRKKLMKALQYFILFLVQGVLSGGETSKMSVTEFMMKYIYRRYETALQQRDSEEVEHVLSKAREIVRGYCFGLDVHQLLEVRELEHLKTTATRIVTMFAAVSLLPVRGINLGNYVEHLVWRILGTEDLIQLPVYIYECFSKEYEWSEAIKPANRHLV